jgi:hypothetical protein
MQILKEGFTVMIDIRGYCKKCQAPIFLNRTDDVYGNDIVTLNCWNGHYQWINIENLAEDLPVETREDLVTHIGFFSLS